MMKVAFIIPIITVICALMAQYPGLWHLAFFGIMMLATKKPTNS